MSETSGRSPRSLSIAMPVLYLPSESKMGVGWTAHRLANELVARGHMVTVFSPCARPADAQYEHVHVQLKGIGRTFRWGFALRRIDFRSYDVLHAHGDDHLVRASRRPSVHVRTMHGSCFDEAVHIHGLKERLRMILLGLTEVVSAVRTPNVIGVSRSALRFYPWLHRTIPNGVDVDAFRPDGLREEAPTVLFVGTYGGRKRGAMLMEQFAQSVLPAIPDAQLWMVCSDAPVARNVHVLGRLSERELIDRYRRARVFCLPSSYEGFGIPYVEALAAGHLVVASKNKGAMELLTGVDGCDLVDDDELAAALVRALRSDLHGDPGRADAYSWANVVAAYEEVYRG
jgi:phosphatidylinositol alpha-mannosyltransferase